MVANTYNAPALEKGLEILELMAGHAGALSMAEIASALGRSKAEIYRMLLTLETKGFIRRETSGTGYEMTGRLFDLGMKHPPRQQLIDAALPHMHALSRHTQQSCHITLVSGDDLVVIARTESEATISLSVKVGFRVSAIFGTSGRVINAFQDRSQKAEWLRTLCRSGVPRDVIRQFYKDMRLARTQGYLVRDSHYTRGITDLVTPLFRGQSSHAVAALVVPYLTHIPSHLSQPDTLEALLETAKLISRDVY